MSDATKRPPLSACERDTLEQLFFQGPTWDGDLCSKTGRDALIDQGYLIRYEGWQTLSAAGFVFAVQLGFGEAKETWDQRRRSASRKQQDDNEQMRRLLRGPSIKVRQFYLGELLTSNGYFNRHDLTETFGISPQQASFDIRDWLEANPGRARYNKSLKRYEGPYA